MPTGAPLTRPPLIEAISEDPVLGRTKLIAEAWDCGPLTQVWRCQSQMLGGIRVASLCFPGFFRPSCAQYEASCCSAGCSRGSGTGASISSQRPGMRSWHPAASATAEHPCLQIVHLIWVVAPSSETRPNC